MRQKLESLKGKVDGVGETIDERLVCFMNSFSKKYKTGIDFKEKTINNIYFYIFIELVKKKKNETAGKIMKKGARTGYFEGVFEKVGGIKETFLKEKAIVIIIEKMVENSSLEEVLEIIKSMDNIFLRERVKGGVAIKLEQYCLREEAFKIANSIKSSGLRKKVLEEMNEIFLKRNVEIVKKTGSLSNVIQFKKR